MAINLTEGAIEAMCNGDTDLKPVLQVADIRLVNTQNPSSATERYRLLLSDGLHLQQGMLATQRNELVKSGALQKGSIIRLMQAVCNVIQGRTIIIMIELEVIQETCPTIGEPKQYVTGGARSAAQVPSSLGQSGIVPGNAQPANPHPPPAPRPSGVGSVLPQRAAQIQSYGGSASNSVAGHYNTTNGSTLHPKPEFAVGNSANAAAASPYGAFNNAKTDYSCVPPNAYARNQQPAYQQPPSMYMNRGPIAKNDGPPRIVPIAALNPYQGRWTIKARVTSKSDLRHYSNPRGDGKVFSFDLLDSDGGEIRVTCFNAVVDQFYSLIEVGKVYLISKGTLKLAQKNFNHLPNDHEIFLDTTSVVQPCFEDDSKIPRQQFHFQPISDIEGLENNAIVDVIGVVSSISPSSSIMRKNGTETQKRSLQLKDMSGRSVEFTLWGNYCNTEGQTLQNMCDSGNFPVLAVKSARVSEFNGKNVGTFFTSQLFIEPDFPEAQRLKEWFDREGKNMPSVSISRETTSLARTDARKTISQIKDEKLGTSEKPDWITVCATISFIKVDSFCYTACPILVGDRPCSKKVTNNGDGKWRCDKCDQSVDECEYRYVLQIQIQDHTAVTWATAFQEVGEEIMGISAKNLYYLKNEEQDEEKFMEIARAAIFNKYIFKLKVKEETFSDEQRVKSTVVKSERVNFTAESRFLLESMDKLKVGDPGSLAAKPENPNIGIGRSGVSHVGISQPASGVSYGTNSGIPGREPGKFNNNTSQFGNQYSGGYVGSSASGMPVTCSSCGGTGHSATNCPSIINGPGGYVNQTVAAGSGSNSGQCYKCQEFGHFARDCPGLSAVPPAYGGSNIGPGRYGGGQRQQVGGF
ncbi:replication protein A 70 kDa DNA-binding subunit A [Beta vulgaris subsp. vulgaris]|uniref:replication protein A 70 kDa DNA-binding subunit A n=1 Tax=Beta vulgaris subsp. vulgaris TaxID=3555 RepID=UPI002036BB8D|nr:replication protein A 70 kDa DNA-binding subunit A [Beta vulgaris subsp. vulgaris]